MGGGKKRHLRQNRAEPLRLCWLL